MTKLTQLEKKIIGLCDAHVSASTIFAAQLTLECQASDAYVLLQTLRDKKSLGFDQLVDVCGVDYLSYGQTQWDVSQVSSQGFCRGVDRDNVVDHEGPRFAVVYHLLSTRHNHRVRVKAWCDNSLPKVASANDLWASASWFERETYEMYGILFEGHPDLRRILTDYGFIGHPFRKDFPVSGHVEMRYDASLKRVIYEPVDIEPRVLVPKVIRHDNRYVAEGVEDNG